jgi:beta-lactamase superfamily II metal-dependent hydrolase
MGDAGCKNKQDGEYIAINSGIDLKSDVLKVGHHGSTYASSRDFLKLVLPEYAVITTSSVTTTGHPHTAALNRLKSFTNNILQSKKTQRETRTRILQSFLGCKSERSRRHNISKI